MSFSFLKQFKVKNGYVPVIILGLLIFGGVVYAANHNPPCFPPGVFNVSTAVASYQPCSWANAHETSNTQTAAKIAVIGTTGSPTTVNKCVQNGNLLDIFIPTNTAGEWSAFSSAAGNSSLHVTLNPLNNGSCTGGGGGGGGGFGVFGFSGDVCSTYSSQYPPGNNVGAAERTAYGDANQQITAANVASYIKTEALSLSNCFGSGGSGGSCPDTNAHWGALGSRSGTTIINQHTYTWSAEATQEPGPNNCGSGPRVFLYGATLEIAGPSQ